MYPSLLDDQPLIDLSPVDYHRNTKKESLSLCQDETLLKNWLNALDTAASRQRLSTTPTDNSPVNIFGNLYLGTVRHATDAKILTGLGITHIIDCSASDLYTSLMKSTPADGLGGPLSPQYYRLRTSDHCSEKLPFDEAVERIRLCQQQKGSRILVCCVTGVNRSAAACVAYVMTATQKPIIEVTTAIAEKAGHILRVEGIQRQLLEFAEQQRLLGSSTTWPKRTNSDDELCPDFLATSAGSSELPQDDSDQTPLVY